MAAVDCVAVLLNREEKPPVCVCGCEVDVPKSEGVVVAVDFAPPRPPNRPPPKPPLLAGCVVPDWAFEVPPPRLPNKLDVVPIDAPVVPPNNPPPDEPLDAGWAPPRFPKSDIAVVLRNVDSAENKAGGTRSRC